MNKRKLHHYWRLYQGISLWLLTGLFGVSLIVSVFALRSNNLHMLELKEKVLLADKNNGDVEAALHELREYVYAHMNTDLAAGPNAIRPPIQLKYRYERLAEAERQRVNAINAQVYTAAQKECERLFPLTFSGGGRVPCIQDYVSRNGAKEKPIPDALYKFDFVSPRWSPDLAGWSVVGSALLFVFTLIRVASGLLINRELRHRA